jgi:hypothetical protein
MQCKQAVDDFGWQCTYMQVMIMDYKLLFPSGSAIAGLVNSFHTPAGAATAK